MRRNLFFWGTGVVFAFVALVAKADSWSNYQGHVLGIVMTSSTTAAIRLDAASLNGTSSCGYAHNSSVAVNPNTIFGQQIIQEASRAMSAGATVQVGYWANTCSVYGGASYSVVDAQHLVACTTPTCSY